ncbi:hypothetical protein ESOMN_v1c07100 [Williamsoniiplasma somnilux]|uniref:GIY-YIG domain-containing protein n=1 Tax=Williamsoniiplasma somnilux TaxID=215578 RepID=A0A2K8NZ42_9MOLU|nr:GIY-YIG nuclease family protein [Williamsoniiplasma somnilux]ATZ19092.1 hypothetical protein ESOMN_v1c07100 [Williamsoniiplasma somnilux]
MWVFVPIATLTTIAMWVIIILIAIRFWKIIVVAIILQVAFFTYAMFKSNLDLIILVAIFALVTSFFVLIFFLLFKHYQNKKSLQEQKDNFKPLISQKKFEDLNQETSEKNLAENLINYKRNFENEKSISYKHWFPYENIKKEIFIKMENEFDTKRKPKAGVYAYLIGPYFTNPQKIKENWLRVKPIYVGSSNNLNRRFKEHIAGVEEEKHKNNIRYIKSREYRKTSKKLGLPYSLRFILLEEWVVLLEKDSKEYSDFKLSREQYWISQLKTLEIGFNTLNTKGNGSHPKNLKNKTD